MDTAACENLQEQYTGPKNKLGKHSEKMWFRSSSDFFQRRNGKTSWINLAKRSDFDPPRISFSGRENFLYLLSQIRNEMLLTLRAHITILQSRER